ncbi:MAG TPA: type II secretion system protein N [Burkholderiaceae bacterium]|nr:type II secretion system protein N [Burkholderiaceae bacterium]
MAMRLLSFAIWALVAASAVFWLTRLLARADHAPAHTVTVSANTAVAAADLSRLLGSTRVAAADAPAPEAAHDARYKLIGVVAPRSAAATGLALIAVGDKPPRPVSLGGVVDGSLVLLAVNHRHAELGPAGGAPTVRLELPAVPEPNRSVRAVPAVAPPPARPASPRPAAVPGSVPLRGAATR